MLHPADDGPEVTGVVFHHNQAYFRPLAFGVGGEIRRVLGNRGLGGSLCDRVESRVNPEAAAVYRLLVESINVKQLLQDVVHEKRIRVVGAVGNPGELILVGRRLLRLLLGNVAASDHLRENLTRALQA